MQVVPLSAVPSQTITVFLGSQGCSLSVYWRRTGLYLDLYVNGLPLIIGVVCQDLNRIIRSAYLGFTGDLCFCDTQGSDDPQFTGLGTRWVLLYLEPGDPVVAQ